MLIDGDNAEPALVGKALAEIAKHGSVITRRVYANWATSGKSEWKKAIHAHGVLPVQQFAYVSGKNATDIALVIEAMDLLHSGTVGGFCIVSSDSDYTRLALRIREQGMFVMGIGRSNTPEPFVEACEVFVRTENLGGADKAAASKPKAGQEQAVRVSTKARAKASNQQPTPSDAWVQTVTQAVNNAKKDSDGWALLSAVGAQIRQIDDAFKPKDYGHRQLGLLIKSRPNIFVTKGSKAAIYVRLA